MTEGRPITPRDEPASVGGRENEAAAASRSLEVLYRVRFDEATPTGTVRPSALLRYAQDCAWAHSERLGFGREWYAERGLFWLVRAVALRLEGGLPTGSLASVTTTVLGFRRVLARRRTTVVGPTGAAVATIETDWVMVADDGTPTRIPAVFPAMMGPDPRPFAPRRVPLPEAPDDASRLGSTVRAHELDPMGHANNAVYLDWFEEAVLELDPTLLSRAPRSYRLEYLLPARPGVRLDARVWRTGIGSAAYRLSDPSGELLRATLQA
jgi:acyl-CoA thioesterase FadM